MSFPLSPSNGQTAVLNNITYTYNSSNNRWTRAVAIITATTSLTVSGTITGGSIRTTTTSTAPALPTVGDIWYNTTDDTLYRYTYDGASSYWVDIMGPTNSISASGLVTGTSIYTNTSSSTSTTTGALVIYGGLGVGDNVNIAGNLTIAGGIPIQAAANFTPISTANNVDFGTLAVTTDAFGVQLTAYQSTLDFSIPGPVMILDLENTGPLTANPI